MPQKLVNEVEQARQAIAGLQAGIESLTASINQKSELIAALQQKDAELSQQIAALQTKDAELVNSIAAKLSTDRVTQSTAVTAAGYAVDARQLNASIDGSLAKKISSLNSSVSSLPADIKRNLVLVNIVRAYDSVNGF